MAEQPMMRSLAQRQIEKDVVVGLGQARSERADVRRKQGGPAGVGQREADVGRTDDLTGQLADDPGSGGVDEPGMLDPVEVGRWDFNAAVACYQVDLPDTCRAPDGAAWGRRLALTSGVDVGVGLTDAGLLLDGTHFAPDPADPLHGVATQEYGRSQRNTVGEGQPPQWQDTPVLRTDVAFTVSAWVRLDAVTGWRVVVSQDTVGTGFDGFELGFRDSNDGEWYFAMRNSPAESDAAKSSIVVAPAENPTGWHHVAATYDPGRRQVRLYVDGDPAGTATTHVGHTPWQATGPLVVGRSDRPGGPGDWLYGTVDDLIAYQGAMSDAAVKALHDLQSPDL